MGLTCTVQYGCLAFLMMVQCISKELNTLYDCFPVPACKYTIGLYTKRARKEGLSVHAVWELIA